MAYPDYDRRPYSYQRDTGRHQTRDTGYSSNSSYSYYAANPPLPTRPSAYSYRPAASSTPRWPPSPSVEDEALSLARELASSTSVDPDAANGEPQARGSVDQYPIIEEIEQPPRRANGYGYRDSYGDSYGDSDSDNADRRFVLLSDPAAPRRKSFAERGNMPHLKTDIHDNDPPVFTERISTPYAYTKPQKEHIAPSSEYLLSPEPLTPSAPSSIPRSVPSRETWDARDARKTDHGRIDSFTQSPLKTKTDVFEDSDGDEDSSHRRTERRPARYSFVKNDLQREDDLRTSVLDGQAKSDQRRSGEPPRTSRARGTYDSSSGSSSHPTPPNKSPRSSTSSLNNAPGAQPRQNSRPSPSTVESSYPSRPRHPDSRPASPRPSSPLYREPLQSKPRPIPSDASYNSSTTYPHSRPSSPRPSSPLYRDAQPPAPRSPTLPPRRAADSPPPTRPISRSGQTSRPSSPLSFSANIPPPHVRAAVSGADRYATYPPTTNDRSRPPARYNDRHDSLPIPMPRIDVRSPSPIRAPKAENPLPYPVDDRPAQVFMPPEEAYQFDHGSYSPAPPSPHLSSRQYYPDSPRTNASPIPASPRERPSTFRPSLDNRQNSNSDDGPRATRVRSDSIRSQSSYDGRRERRAAPLERPLPPCPRSEPNGQYTDWYTLDNCPNFDMCPPCYNAVFSDTPFSVYFQQSRRPERPLERICDFSSPWMRLAWLLTIKQRRPSLDLIYAIARIGDMERPCPKDREVNATWYGISDQRDGVHVSNFAVCPCDMKMIETLFPSIRGYFTRLPAHSHPGAPRQLMCSLRVTSRRFPKYLDLLVELDAESQNSGRAPDMSRFIQLVREHAYKGECCRDKKLVRKPWHYIPSLPEFTVCEECYDDVVYPAITEGNPIAKLFNRTIQLVPGEDPDGSSCCLYSPRMRGVWNRALDNEDLAYLKRKALDRKRVETRLGGERKELLLWSDRLSRGGDDWERAKEDLREVEAEWRDWE